MKIKFKILAVIIAIITLTSVLAIVFNSKFTSAAPANGEQIQKCYNGCKATASYCLTNCNYDQECYNECINWYWECLWGCIHPIYYC